MSISSDLRSEKLNEIGRNGDEGESFEVSGETGRFDKSGCSSILKSAMGLLSKTWMTECQQPCLGDWDFKVSIIQRLGPGLYSFCDFLVTR
jgi:hypothetical protein